MKKLIGLGIAVAVIIALVTTGTFALFSDTETSEVNQFTAGIIDLEVDCDGDTIFAATDDPLPKIFEYLPASDIKPGDSGEVTLSLHLKDDSNDADLWMQLTSLVDDGGLNPESEDAGDDVISDAIEVLIWLDEGTTAGWQGTGTDTDEGDNEYDTGEEILFGTVAAGGGTLYSLSTTNSGKLTVMDDAVACTTYYVGWSWILPSTVGNEAQGDYCTFNIVFGADQITTP